MKNIVDKAASRGAESLTDEELVAVIVADGGDDDGAKSVAHCLLKNAGSSLVGLARVDLPRLRMMSGLGRQRALRLKAAAEFGRRVAIADTESYECITSDSDVVRIMEPMLGVLKHEECWALYLASSGRVLEHMRVSQGGVQATVVDCKLIIKRAIELLASQIVLVHNHPSGSVEPSRHDVELTERVAEAAKLFDIRLLDHVIVARGAHYSFRANGIVK
jgi:DNA repair protein RadC